MYSVRFRKFAIRLGAELRPERQSTIADVIKCQQNNLGMAAAVITKYLTILDLVDDM